MKVYIFNPENDMALADGKPGYTAPAIIRQMREELCWLPQWWAEEGDIVWNGTDTLRLQPGDEIVPWGWSPALIHQLRQAGVTDEFLPTDGQMEALRQLSHRQTAVEALRQMHNDGLIGNQLCGEATVCKSMEEIERLGEGILFKSPWSSSGKGLMRSDAPHAQEWCRNILKQQGSIVAEKLLTRVADFALEFQLDGEGGVEYTGLSLFFTGDIGSYTGNWVAPEGQKFQWLMQYIHPQTLVDIRRWWERYLTRFSYRGPVGVDMMFCQEGVCPCIEINWRMTMGMVANICSRQGKYGKLIVEYIYGHYAAEVEAFS